MRRSKTLEKMARTIKDADDFVEHVFHIARAYRVNHELESGAKNRPVRQALRAFHKHASALTLWLDSANRSSRNTTEFEALGLLKMTPSQNIASHQWLKNATQVSSEAEKALRSKKLQHAPQVAAQAIRATFEHHKLKVSYQATEKKQSDAVRLLCAVAKDSADMTMTPAAAKVWLQASAKMPQPAKPS